MLRTAGIVAMAAILGGCATGTQMQAECEAKEKAFPDVVRCTRQSIAERAPSKLREPSAKLYLLRGEQLATDVEAGKISDIDARVAWQKLYIELFEPTKEDRAAAMRALSRIQLSPVTPARPPVSTSCSTRAVFGQLRTDCTTQ